MTKQYWGERMLASLDSKDDSEWLDRGEPLSAMLRRVASVVPAGAWSCAEVFRFATADFAKLLRWASRLDSYSVRWRLNNTNVTVLEDLPKRFSRVTHSHVLCLPLLSLMIEILRRHHDGGRDTYGPIVSKLPVRPDVKLLLFGLSGQPTFELKAAMRALAHDLQMRHHFDEIGQIYYRFLWLQAGLSRHHWLSVGHLRPGDTLVAASELRFGTQASQSFGDLLRSIRDYRFEFISPRELRAGLTRSNWLLEEWIDPLIERLNRNEDLAVDVFPDADPAGAGDQETDPRLIGSAHLTWFDDQPLFVCPITEALKSLCVDRSVVQFWCGDQCRATLIAQTDGSLAVVPAAAGVQDDAGVASLLLDPLRDGPATEFLVLDADHNTLALENVVLWESGSLLCAFDRSGEPIDLDLPAKHPATLVIPAECHVEPVAALECDVANALVRIVRLSPHASELAVVQAQDALTVRTWSSQQSTNLAPSPFASLHVVCSTPTPHAPGDAITLDVSWPGHGNPSVRMKVASKPLRSVQASPHIPAGFMHELSADQIPGILSAIIQVGTTPPSMFSRKIGLSGIGMVETKPSGRRVFGRRGVTRGTLDRWEAGMTSTVYSVTAPVKSGTMLVLTEGSRFIARVPSIPRPMRGLAGLDGLGEPLLLRDGLFSAFVDRPHSLTHRVVDRGVCHHEGLFPNLQQRKLRVRLRRPLEPRQGEHMLVIVNTVGELHTIAEILSEVVIGDSSARYWGVGLPESVGQPWAVAVAYNGHRIGAAWFSDWHQRVAELQTAVAPARLAEIVRWFHFPVLEEPAAATIKSLSRTFAPQFLNSWTRAGEIDTVNGPSLVHATAGPWQSALTRLWEGWRPDAATAQALCSEHPVEPLKTLNAIHPVICWHVVRGWLEKQPANERSRYEAMLRKLLTGIDSQAEINAGGDSLAQRCLRAFRRFEVADGFLDGILKTARTLRAGGHVQDRDRHNLAAALGFSGEMSKLVLCALWWPGAFF